ncbi:MAG: ABC transporter permease [Firmicutes bacterium]|nr:ABC transporter permease [Bacillota bacterium]
MVATGLVLLGAVAGAAVLAPFLAPVHPEQLSLAESLRPPGQGHPFGTDYYGRDVLSRVLFGARVSLCISLAAQFVALIVGVGLGAVAGYFGGWVDALIMRSVDVFLALPDLLIAIGIAAALGPGVESVLVALGLVGWPGLCRLVRGEVLSLRERDFVQAARAIGAGDWWIVTRHILPHLAAPLLVATSLGLGSRIMQEASLSFLGLGVQPPVASWGSMINYGLRWLSRAPWLVVFPGLAIAAAVLGFNLLGDGLRDILDPRLRD